VFGISFEELIVLAILAFILFGPEKLPEYAQKLGRLVAKLRAASSELTQQYQNPFHYPPEPPKLPTFVFCPYCRQELAPDYVFCPHCGHRVEKESASPYPQQPQPQTPDREDAAGSSPGPADSRGLPPDSPAGSNPLAEMQSGKASPLAPLSREAGVIRSLQPEETDLALGLINDAAQAYKGVIPEDCWQEPYMPREELLAEIQAGVNFRTYEEAGRVLGVMGRQDLGEVTLIRHAYVHPGAQRRGVGAQLLAHLLNEITAPVLVGTWEAAWWAIRFYQKHGFQLVTPAEKDRLLRTYWTVSPRQIETSVVLGDPRWFALAGVRDQDSEVRG
jgi:GNAT superfamily N-acetyltransferase